MKEKYQFFVPGTPAPGGSKRFVGHSRAGRAILIDAAGTKNKNWRASVQVFAQQAGCTPLDGPLSLTVMFCMPRPKAHFRTGKRMHELRDDAPFLHTNAPDATKLLRSTEDALTGIAWHDDAQVAIQNVTKVYTGKPGASITIEQIDPVTTKP